MSVEKALAEQHKLKSQLRAVRNSFSYRLGNMLVQAVYKPGRNTVLLPYRLIGLCVTEFKKRRAPAATELAKTGLPAGTPVAKSDIAPSMHATPDARRKGDICSMKGIAEVGRCHEVEFEDVTLSPLTRMIKERYIARHGTEGSLLGGYYEYDWRRIEYIGSLLPGAECVLDVGIGTGAFLNLLMSLNRFQRILGIDIVRHSRFYTLFESQLYEIMYASVTNLPFKNKSIDVVTCMEVLEHLNLEQFLAALPELRRVAKHLLIITVPYNQPKPLPSFHKLRFTDSDLLTYFPHGDFTLLKKPKYTPSVIIMERL